MKGRKHYNRFVVDHSFPGSSGIYNMVSQVLEQTEDLTLHERRECVGSIHRSWSQIFSANIVQIHNHT